MSAIKRYFVAGLRGIPFLMWCNATFLRKFSKNPTKYPLEVRYNKVRKHMCHLSSILHVDVEAEGMENVLPDQNICMVGNHIGDYDPICLAMVLKDPTAFVGKIQILSFGAIREAMIALDSVLIDRDDLKQTLKTMLRVQKDMVEKRKNWVIFPEGTRRKDSRLLMGDFHPGTFRTPMKAGIPIVPFAIIGSDRIFRYKPVVYKRYPVFIKFLEPIMPEDYKDKSTEEVANIARDRIQKALCFELREKDHKYMSETYPKKYKYHY